MSEVGVLLLAHGSPSDLADMAAYLKNVRRGRDAPAELVAEMQRRYGLVPGGHSPLLARTQAQAVALQAALSARGLEARTAVGMRFWDPYVSEGLAELVEAGAHRIVGLPMAPQYSRLSVGAYERTLREADGALGSDVEVSVAMGWHVHPGFIGALAARLGDARAGLDADVPVIFTVHSLPERVLAEGDPYPAQARETAAAVARQAGVESWRFSYQSAGATDDAWLEPDVEQVLDALKEEGATRVLVQPVGFVCDHVEILYDVDIQYADYAKGRGIELTRTESLNDAPQFIGALADVIETHLAA